MMFTILRVLKQASPDDASNISKLIKHSLIEFICTATFVYFGTLSAVSTGTKLGGGSGKGEDVARIFPIAFCFGITIMCMAYSIGHYSGCHLNPGVSLLMFFRREMSAVRMGCYWIAQFTGAMLGSVLVWGSVQGLAKSDDNLISRNPPFTLGSNILDPEIAVASGFLLELMGSFFFYLVISQTALDKKGIAETSLVAIPIGFSLVVVHICLIPFTGCGVNPARTFGPSIITCMADRSQCTTVIGDWWWIYYIGPFCGALLVSEFTALLKWQVEPQEVEYPATTNPVPSKNEKEQLIADEEVFPAE